MSQQHRRKYGIWYRHSGEDQVDGIPSFKHCEFRQAGVERHILEHIGTNHITHMYVRGARLPRFDNIAPQLKALRIDHLADHSQLESLSSLRDLETLTLHAISFFEGLPDVIGQLPSLQELNLEKCYINSLPENFSSLANLKYLSLPENNFSEGLPILLGDLTTLEELDLSYCYLRTLPDSLSSLKNLKRLSLDNARGLVTLYHNRFPHTFPDAVGKLLSLQTLDLRCCYLSKLPECLSSLTNLEILNLDHNHFSHGLSDKIGELKSLEELHLEDCQLTDLPMSMESLCKLKLLKLNKNSLSVLPQVIGQLTSLDKLYLKCCDLKNLSARLSSLKHLQHLDISDNQLITGLNEWIGELFSLKVLSLENCQLKELPTGLADLQELKILSLSCNNFTEGLPGVVGSLSRLQKLHLGYCQLADLPENFGGLSSLEMLYLDDNHFRSFPPSICKLNNLQKLTLCNNHLLEGLHRGLLSLDKLEEISVTECPSIVVPPLDVVNQGVLAIKQYFRDLITEGEGKDLPAVTISVIGYSGSGKTSLIKTLQTNTRDLDSPSVSTSVFNFEKVKVDGMELRFIDFGGQEIYHHTYRLTLKANCVPVIVVNIEMYETLCKEIGHREAVRQLFFDWMAHLYLTQPDLAAPKLVITHKDMFTDEDFERLKAEFLLQCNGVRDTILTEERQLQRNDFQQIKSLAEGSDLFHETNIFSIGDKYDRNVFESIKKELLESCKDHFVPIPKIWEDIEKSILSRPTAVSLFDILCADLKALHGVEMEHLKFILTYMHRCGKLLWYKDDKKLRKFVFSNISDVTKLLSILYHHDNTSQWSKREENFVSNRIHNRDFSQESYQSSVQSFKETGVISWMLLAYLIRSESKFKTDDEIIISLKLLSAFRLAFGPVPHCNEQSYIVPFFAQSYLANVPKTNYNIQLHADIMFKGLPLPQYAYHELAVKLLELIPSEHAAPAILHNGALVVDHVASVHLTHNVYEGRASFKVLCDTKDMNVAWIKLINVINSSVLHVKKTWERTGLVCVFYCSHCKLKEIPHPQREINPSWSALSNASQHSADTQWQMVKCGDEMVPSVFKFPCQFLSGANKKELKKYVKSVKRRKKQRVQQHPPSCEVDPEVAPLCHDTSYSEYTLVELHKLLVPDLQPLPTENEAIKRRFNMPNKVYEMTSPRGLALIINNAIFDDQRLNRLGSEADVCRVEKMLRDFDFDVETVPNLNGKEMLEAIDTRLTQYQDILNDYGMYALVLMSHGAENDCIAGTDKKLIQLKDVYYLLSSHNCPGLAKKPKLVIVEACDGGLWDLGEYGRHRSTDVLSMDEMASLMVRPERRGPIDHLNTDGIITIKSCFKGHSSIRHDEQGSLLISCLVFIFYKYACVKDMKELLDMVQHHVNEESIRLANKYPEHCFGQSPTVSSHLTGKRLLYLFPGYNGK